MNRDAAAAGGGHHATVPRWTSLQSFKPSLGTKWEQFVVRPKFSYAGDGDAGHGDAGVTARAMAGALRMRLGH